MLLSLAFCLMTLASLAVPPKKEIYFSGSQRNDLYPVLVKEGFVLHRFDSPAAAIQKAPNGAAVFVMAEGYPAKRSNISADLLHTAGRKKIRLYLEYPSDLPGLSIPVEPLHTRLERGVITSPVFGAELKPMSILGINDCHVLPVKADNPLIILAKVAGFDKAEYGIDDVPNYPLLFERGNVLIATTKLSNFATGRYGPNDAWKNIFSYIVTWATGVKDVQFKEWPSYVVPMYARTQPLPKNARARSVEKGVEWFANGRFYIHPSWEDTLLKYQGDGSKPFGPPVSQGLPNGDGSMGLLEGHASNIYHDGSQQYRFWMRADVQGEAAYALAAAGSFLGKKDYYTKATNLTNYVFRHSNLRAQERNDKSSPSYGLIGWSVTHPHVYYGDDNARAILGILGASAFMNTNQWDREMAEAILANFRTTGKHGYRGERQEDKDLQKLGWQHFWERDIQHPAPHFESWMWACYLWLYEKTGYEPLLAKTKNAIRLTMEDYPHEWRWTNGIQQERARMVLPLAWLVRVEDTPEHRKWLDTIVQKLLENQVESGAIREELGGEGKGRFGRTKSNKEYGLHEAPLIFKNGDPIADMLYTSNFAFFSLNEAAHATGNKQYKEAVNKLADFLTRIQVKSDKHKDLDGAWFRAFDYDKWEYWASNADVGWGAWGTLTGWTQSWIVATQVLTAKNQSFWELTKNSTIKKEMPQTLEVMFPKN